MSKDQVTEVGETEGSLQGPHNWRKGLKPVFRHVKQNSADDIGNVHSAER